MGTPIRVLIVEDSEDDAWLLLREIRRGGYDPTFVRVDTPAGMESALAEDAWDIVMVDYVLPQFSGPAALASLQDSGLDLPAIIVSGVIGEETAVSAMRAGARDYILKDRLTRLVPAIERELGELERRKEHKRVQEQLFQSQKMETVGRLAGGIAHDFNNMLTAIMGYTQLGITGLVPGDPVCSDLDAVLRSAERASKLASQLLAFSRQQISEPKVFDLNQLILDSGKLLRSVFDKDVDFVILLSPNLDLVSADPNQIDQVLMNLMVNARDAMPTGGKLVIETTNLNVDQAQADRWNCPPGKFISLTVNDNGIGMSEEVEGKVFDPFFTTKETGKGTGLGLSICYGIIKQNGGHIEVDSEIGNGTTFKIFLPSSTQEVSLLPQNQKREDLPNGKETILLVEDEPMIRAMCTRVLYDNGYKVLEAANGEEALRLAQNHAAGVIDLLLTDVVMPQMGGIELTRCLGEARPEIKILLISGYMDEAPILAWSPKDNIPFLQKPFLPSALLSQVREVLDG